MAARVTLQVVVAGGGIGGLAAALAAARAGCHVRMLERSREFSQIGAGIQLGPNVVRVLHGWGLADALSASAAVPERLQVRRAGTGKVLATLALGRAMSMRYGAPYLTMHRADLHAVLLIAAQQQGNLKLHAGCPLQSFSQTAQAVTLQTASSSDIECDALVGADGLWSGVRQQLLADGLPRRTGHLAYRAMVAQASLPVRLRSNQVTVWLGPQMHVVHYPVRRGEHLNIVAFVHGQVPDDALSLAAWDHSANARDLQAALGGSCADLRDLIEAAGDWRLWVMYDRPPMNSAHQHAQGRVALLGDAAHPMRPYLAQGAGMAIEDAAELGNVLGQAKDTAFDVAALLQRYALNRWQRNARVQARALRNGTLFHAQGPLRLARDAALRTAGAYLLDMPWLYGAKAGNL